MKRQSHRIERIQTECEIVIKTKYEISLAFPPNFLNIQLGRDMHSTYVRRQKDNKPKETNQQAPRKEEKEEEEGKNKAKQKTFEML